MLDVYKLSTFCDVCSPLAVCTTDGGSDHSLSLNVGSRGGAGPLMRQATLDPNAPFAIADYAGVVVSSVFV